MSVLSKPYFHDEAEAFRFVEAIIWPQGPVCPHCGCTGRTYVLEGVRTKATKKNPEGIVRHGLKKCGDCRKQFTVRIGTIFEESHLPMTKWLQAIFLMSSSKKGVSSHQLHRTLEVTYKTAWFLAHRIREAMRTGELAPFGGAGTPVEVDETFIGREPGMPVKRAFHHPARSTFTATSPSSTSAIPTVSRWAWTISPAPSWRCKVSLESASRTGQLVSGPKSKAGKRRPSRWRTKPHRRLIGDSIQ